MDKKDKKEYNSVSVYQAETESFATLQHSASFTHAYTEAKGSCFVAIGTDFLQIGGGPNSWGAGTGSGTGTGTGTSAGSKGKSSDHMRTVSLFAYQDGEIIPQDFEVQFNPIDVVEFLI